LKQLFLAIFQNIFFSFLSILNLWTTDTEYLTAAGSANNKTEVTQFMLSRSYTYSFTD